MARFSIFAWCFPVPTFPVFRLPRCLSSSVSEGFPMIELFRYHIVLYTWLFSQWFYFRKFRESDPRENFHFNWCLFIITKISEKITKLTPCEFLHLVQNRENVCTKKLWHIRYTVYQPFFYLIGISWYCLRICTDTDIDENKEKRIRNKKKAE